MSARDAILGTLRQRLQGQAGRLDAGEIEARLAAHRRGLVPARGQGDSAHRVALLEEQVTALAGTLRRVPNLEAVPQAIADYLRDQNLPPRLKRAPHPLLQGLPFERTPLLEVGEGRGEGSDLTALTPVFCAVAETGTLVLQSGPETPTTLAFLPDNHIAVVKASQVVGSYEEAFDLTRQARGEGRMPRSFNFVTGPSRTADIEQKIQLGAHGPRRLHIILVEDV